MKGIYFLLLLIFLACTSKQNLVSFNHNISDLPNEDTLQPIQIDFKLDIHETYIKNTSSKKIDALVNTIQNFSNNNAKELHFKTECMTCGGIYPYQKGILFGGQLLILKDEAQFLPSRIYITDNLIPIKPISNNRSKGNIKFKFSEGNGSINFIATSCDDANYYRLTINYSDGKIMVDSLLNAAFYEYDLDQNGTQEHYFIGTRNCSQEVSIFRIRE